MQKAIDGGDDGGGGFDWLFLFSMFSELIN